MKTTEHTANVDASTPDELWEGIAAWIDELGLQAGDQLPSLRELASHLGARPTIVRDVLLQAQARGTVKIVPRVGAFLQQLPAANAHSAKSPAESIAVAAEQELGRERHNLLHLLDARRTLEIELVGRAAERRRVEDLLPARKALETLLQLSPETSRADYTALDLQFHEELARLAGNSVLLALLRTLIPVVRAQTLEALAAVPTNTEMRTLSDRQHAAIYAAVAAGDAPRAQREMREHLSVSYDYLMRMLQSPPTR